MKIIYSLLPAQRDFLSVKPGVQMDVCVYQGGYGSTCGGAVLEDIATGKAYTMLELWESKRSITVQAIGYDGEPVKAIALPPVREGIGSLYSVKMESGLSITVTAAHRFLRGDTWVALSDLNPGDSLVVGEVALSGPCATEYVQLLAEHAGLQARYYPDQNQHDEHPHQAIKADQAFLPQQLYIYNEQLHEQNVCYGAAHRQKSHYTAHQDRHASSQNLAVIGHHPYSGELPFAPLSEKSPLSDQSHENNNLLTLTHKSDTAFDLNEDEILSRGGCRASLESLKYKIGQHQAPLQSQFGKQASFPAQEPFAQTPLSQPVSVSYKPPYKLDTIESITFIKEDYFYDIHVPGYNNYLANGFINHNSGKSFVGSFLGDRLSQKYPNNLGLVVAQTYPLVRDTTLRSYWEHFDKYGYVRGRDYEWSESKATITYPNGSMILFRHLDDPNRVKSLNLGWAHMEEMGDMDETGFLMLLSRLRRQGIPRTRLFGTTNPQAKKDWIYRVFVEENKTNLDPEKGPLIHYRRIIAPTTENIHLSPVYIANMKAQYSAEYYRANVLGEDIEFRDGLVCKTWSVANIDDLEYFPELRLFLTCDFNVDPMCWMVAQRHKLPGGKHEYHFIDEICIPNTNIVSTAEEFFRRYGKHKAELVVTGDASGRQRSDSSANPNDSKYKILLNTLSGLGMKNMFLDVPAANPHQDIRIETWNGMVCNNEGVRRVKADRTKCPRFIWNMNNLEYVKGSGVINEPSKREIEKDITNTLKFTKHPFDAASYLVYRYDPIRADSRLYNTTPSVTAQYVKTI